MKKITNKRAKKTVKKANKEAGDTVFVTKKAATNEFVSGLEKIQEGRKLIYNYASTLIKELENGSLPIGILGKKRWDHEQLTFMSSNDLLYGITDELGRLVDIGNMVYLNKYIKVTMDEYMLMHKLCLAYMDGAVALSDLRVADIVKEVYYYKPTFPNTAEFKDLNKKSHIYVTPLPPTKITRLREIIYNSNFQLDRTKDIRSYYNIMSNFFRYISLNSDNFIDELDLGHNDESDLKFVNDLIIPYYDDSISGDRI